MKNMNRNPIYWYTVLGILHWPLYDTPIPFSIPLSPGHIPVDFRLIYRKS